MRFLDWFRYRFVKRHQYHLVRTGLEPGYCDTDYRMLYSCMALLCEYVELEHGGAENLASFSNAIRGKPDPNAPDGACVAQADNQDEAVAIYRWWKFERPNDEKTRDALCMELYSKRMRTKPVLGTDFHELLPRERTEAELLKYRVFRDVEKKIDDDEESMLLRLMAIRRTLWT